MISLFQDSVFFGVLISLAAYAIGLLLKIKTGWSLMNPLLISIILVICTLLITGVDYKTYNAGANIISYLLTPATICLAVPLYQQVELLKKNYRAVLIGILSGVLASLCSSSGFGVPLQPCSLCYILAKIHHHCHRYWCF